MKNKALKEQDDLVRAAIQKISPEMPGPDFVRSVMWKAEREKSSLATSFRQQPLISVRGWLVISIFLIFIFTLVTFLDTDGGTWSVFLVQFEEFMAPYLSLFVSRLFVLASISCAVLFFVQIWFLSRRINKVA
jgi:hypothetical protein